MNFSEYPQYRIKEALTDPRYKIKLCNNFLKRGTCKYNLLCRFAHGAEDLIALQVGTITSNSGINKNEYEAEKHECGKAGEVVAEDQIKNIIIKSRIEDKNLLKVAIHRRNRLEVFCLITKDTTLTKPEREASSKSLSSTKCNSTVNETFN